MRPTVSCNNCAYTTFMPHPVEAEDWIVCPECNNKQRAEDCTQCKVARPGEKPFRVVAIGVNAKFLKGVSSMNSKFSSLVKSYGETQQQIVDMTDAVKEIGRDLYRKCSSEISRAVFTANNIDTEGIVQFMASPYIVIAVVQHATVEWLDTPRVITVPDCVKLHIGVPLGKSPTGNRYYLVSRFTLMQYDVPGEVIEAVAMDVPLGIRVGSLHISGADMDEFEDSITRIEYIRRGEDGLPGSSGVSPLSAATFNGGAIDGTNYRTAEITNPIIAIPILGSMGVPIKNRIKVTGKLTALSHIVPDPDESELTLHDVWASDILSNSNCHLFGGDIDTLTEFIFAAGICLISRTGRHAKAIRAAKLLYIGNMEESKRQMLTDNITMSSGVSILEQEDYDDADLIIVDGEEWMRNPKITSNLVTCLASTDTPICVWTKNPEADLLDARQDIYGDGGTLMSGTILRYISSLCPYISGDIEGASERPLQFGCTLISMER